jgi:intracellular sulfur oxidation DsrE/DsrF family protein
MKKGTRMKMANRWITIAVFVGLGLAGLTWAAKDQEAKPLPPIHIDIPVKLEKVNVVFNLDHLAFVGDLPLGIKALSQFANRFTEMGVEGQIIGVFHSEAAHLTLNDTAYNAARNVTTGNPHKGLLADLMKQGVQIEECAVSMKAHHWSNEDLLPGVKVNGGAVVRVIQLVQQGYVQMQP